MFTLIKMDLKQRIKSPLTWFIILILGLMSMINILEMKDQRLNRPFKGHDAFALESVGAFEWGERFNEQQKKLFPKAYSSELILEKTEQQIIEANKKNDVKEVVRLMAFHELLFAKHLFVSNDLIMNTVFEKKVIEMWKDLGDGIGYEDIDFRSFYSHDDSDKDWTLLIAKYYHQLYKNDFEPIYQDDVNNITYLYDYFFNIVPKLILVISIILIYNIINKEKNMGSLKLVITQSTSRWKYYLSKWITGVLHVVFVVILPAITISSVLGILNGFKSMKYPTFYLKGSMTRFKAIPNYLDALKKELGYYPKLQPYTFSYYAPVNKKLTNYGHSHSRMEIISFYKYMLMVILLTVLFIAFAVALTQLISALINKELISFALVSSIFVVGTLVSSPFKHGKHLNLSPFTMENASRIVTGTYNVTALTSTIILILSTVVLLSIGCKYFKKKEI